MNEHEYKAGDKVQLTIDNYGEWTGAVVVLIKHSERYSVRDNIVWLVMDVATGRMGEFCDYWFQPMISNEVFIED